MEQKKRKIIRGFFLLGIGSIASSCSTLQGNIPIYVMGVVLMLLGAFSLPHHLNARKKTEASH